jgi:hypothetical protein
VIRCLRSVAILPGMTYPPSNEPGEVPWITNPPAVPGPAHPASGPPYGQPYPVQPYGEHASAPPPGYAQPAYPAPPAPQGSRFGGAHAAVWVAVIVVGGLILIPLLCCVVGPLVMGVVGSIQPTPSP